MSQHRRSLITLLTAHTDAPYDPEMREFIEGVASALYERHEDFSQWPESVRYFYACYDLNYQVGNGGFAQAAYNVPELIPIAQKAFEKFGRMNASKLCGRFVAMLPAEIAEHVARGFSGKETLQEVFEHFAESKLAELDKQIPIEFWADDMLQLLVEQNREDFMSVD